MSEESFTPHEPSDAMHQLICDLFRQYHRALITEAAYLLQKKNLAEADDVVMDTFEVIIRRCHLDKVEPEKYKAYIFSAVRNNCLSAQRKAETDKRRKDRFEETEPRFETGEQLERWDTRRGLQDAMQSLPGQQRLAFEKSYLEGKPHRQIAVEMELKLETVKSHIKIALKNLRNRLRHLR